MLTNHTDLTRKNHTDVLKT